MLFLARKETRYESNKKWRLAGGLPESRIRADQSWQASRSGLSMHCIVLSVPLSRLSTRINSLSNSRYRFDSDSWNYRTTLRSKCSNIKLVFSHFVCFWLGQRLINYIDIWTYTGLQQDPTTSSPYRKFTRKNSSLYILMKCPIYVLVLGWFS